MPNRQRKALCLTTGDAWMVMSDHVDLAALAGLKTQASTAQTSFWVDAMLVLGGFGQDRLCISSTKATQFTVTATMTREGACQYCPFISIWRLRQSHSLQWHGVLRIPAMSDPFMLPNSSCRNLHPPGKRVGMDSCRAQRRCVACIEHRGHCTSVRTNHTMHLTACNRPSDTLRCK